MSMYVCMCPHRSTTTNEKDLATVQRATGTAVRNRQPYFNKDVNQWKLKLSTTVLCTVSLQLHAS
jgi:hypothetical protein